jgi:hypothetical protein
MTREAAGTKGASPRRFVMVIGMHRSGTSAVAGMLGALGLELPVATDQMKNRSDNPSHFESVSLTRENDSLLRQMGGSWSGPPELSDGWQDLPALAVRIDRSRRIALRAFPGTGAAAWKDPQNCLLLPYWRSVLGEPLAAVFVWRAPVAVARSLSTRDGFSTSHGLALWERYNSEALQGLDGLEVLGTCYDELVANPASFSEECARWLDQLGIPAPPGARDVDAACRVISTDLRHSHEAVGSADDTGDLERILRSTHGAHRPWRCPPLPRAPMWQTDLLAERRGNENATRHAKDIEELMRNSLAASAKYRSKHAFAVSTAALRRFRGRLVSRRAR